LDYIDGTQVDPTVAAQLFQHVSSLSHMLIPQAYATANSFPEPCTSDVLLSHTLYCRLAGCTCFCRFGSLFSAADTIVRDKAHAQWHHDFCRNCMPAFAVSQLHRETGQACMTGDYYTLHFILH